MANILVAQENAEENGKLVDLPFDSLINIVEYIGNHGSFGFPLALSCMKLLEAFNAVKGKLTGVLYSETCTMHEIPTHPERPERVNAVLKGIRSYFPECKVISPRTATLEELQRFHPEHHQSFIFHMCNKSETLSLKPNKEKDWEYVHLDEDTTVMPHTRQAALLAAGSVCQAVDLIMNGNIKNAFCVVRPPGHHAESRKAMGFCFFNNVGIGALHAQKKYKFEKIAIIDFDVHHGNGTQERFFNEPNVFYASTHQGRFYPGTGHAHEKGINNNIVNVPLRAGSGSLEFRQAFTSKIVPALDLFAPNFIFISAGFDAHKDDPLGELQFQSQDYYWVTKEILLLAWKHCQGRVISVLEGGYNLRVLEESGGLHMKALVEGSVCTMGTLRLDEDDLESEFSKMSLRKKKEGPIRVVLVKKHTQKIVFLKSRKLEHLKHLIKNKFPGKIKKITDKHGTTILDDQFLETIQNDDTLFVD